MNNFKPFAAAVKLQFAAMSAHELYRVDVPGDVLWQAYLAAFPDGTNPIYKTNTEHDGNYDKAFVRRLGNVVHVDEAGKLHSIWDAENLPYPYDVVCAHVRTLVADKPIASLFRTKEHKLGYESTVQEIPGEAPIRWYHFHADVAQRHQSYKPDAELGVANSTIQVMGRGFTELTFEAINTTLDLIEQNALYRGAEFKASLERFRAVKLAYDKAEGLQAKNLVLWGNVNSPSMRIRNTAIGTLLIDLSGGLDLEAAVRKYERVVAPTNYKRPTALITPAMVQQATETIQTLGLESALERRYATMADLSVNNVIWVNREAAKAMKGGGVLDTLLADTKAKAKPVKEATAITIDQFMADVVPQATAIELLFSNSLQSNLMSLTAPVDPDAGSLFKWKNNFAWSYNGDITDSELRKAVQAAGGRVDGEFRFSHSWNYNKRNASLMDLHVFMPGSKRKAEDGVHDHYGNNERVGWNRRQHLKSGGVQDVDYVNPAPVGYVPVENITFPSRGRMPEGEYVCQIHNWQLRSPTESGVKAEIEFDGNIFEYEIARAMKHKEWITVAVVTLKNGQFSIDHKLPHGASTHDVWGVKTETYVPVSTLLYSPNHWDGEQTGNKHWFFILKGCKNDMPTRGIYNEFLKPELEAHRKVFEVLGSKTKCEPIADQLSGLGFSSTKRETVTARVTTANSTRTYKISF